MTRTLPDKDEVRFLLLEGIHQSATDTLQQAGYHNVEYLNTPLTGSQLLEKAPHVDFIGIRSRTHLTRQFFEDAGRLLAVGCFGIDTEHIDLEAACERGIAVFDATRCSARALAQQNPGEPLSSASVNNPEQAAVPVACRLTDSSLGAQASIGREVAEKLVNHANTGTTLSALNLPEVALPALPGSHRLLHLHKNVPGVLNQINRVFSEHGINIAAQYCRTNSSIGSVIVDLDAEPGADAVRELHAIDATLRCRILS